MYWGSGGALIPFVGPYFDFAFTPDNEWAWTAARGWLEVLPGAATVLGGFLLLTSRNRFTAMLGGWLTVFAGAWFVVGRAMAGPLGLGDAGAPVAATEAKGVALELAYFYGLGALIIFLVRSHSGGFGPQRPRHPVRAARRHRDRAARVRGRDGDPSGARDAGASPPLARRNVRPRRPTSPSIGFCVCSRGWHCALVRLIRWLYQLLTRVMSLRIIVIVAALSVVALVIILGAWVWFGVTNDQYSQLDRRLDSVSSLGDISIAAAQRPGLGRRSALAERRPGAHRTHQMASTVSVPATSCCRNSTTATPTRRSTASSTASAPSPRERRRSRSARRSPKRQRRIDELHRRVLLICGGVIVGTVLVGWVMWLIMINPFRLLAQQARAINAQSNPDEVQVRGVQEAVEIAEAVEGMLARIGDEQQRTKAALESARDFAAVASHELRTPLTAMRTNLEVLSTLDLRDEQRKEVIGDVMRTQSRIEATLTALERLAQGELTTVDDFVPVDITELLDRAAHDAHAQLPQICRCRWRRRPRC